MLFVSEAERRVRAWDSTAVEVDLPILLGKLQNLLIAGELPDCKLLVYSLNEHRGTGIDFFVDKRS